MLFYVRFVLLERISFSGPKEHFALPEEHFSRPEENLGIPFAGYFALPQSILQFSIPKEDFVLLGSILLFRERILLFLRRGLISRIAFCLPRKHFALSEKQFALPERHFIPSGEYFQAILPEEHFIDCLEQQNGPWVSQQTSGFCRNKTTSEITTYLRELRIIFGIAKKK